MWSIPRVVARVPVLRGVVRLAISGYALLFKERFMVEHRMGLLLLLDRENAIDWQLLLSGGWERPELEELLGLAEEIRRHHGGDAVFFDIGAHWALYALVAHRSGRFKQIIAFEPDPINFSQLQANMFLNGSQADIQAFQLAATDRDRSFGLSQRTRRNRGGTRVSEVDQNTRVTCRGVRVDSLFDFSDKILVIKIDVEGHELEALEGLTNLVSKNRCVIQIEIWNVPEGETERRFEIICRMLAPHGIKFVRAINADFFFVSEERT
jgi:FkbM family methyltransferase